MRKIIGIIHPFDLYQTLYVYEDGNKLDIQQVKLDDVPAAIFKFSKQYDVNQVDLSGAAHFAKGLIKKIKQEEMNKYSENKLDIKCI